MRDSTRPSLVACIWTSLLLAWRRKLDVSFLALVLITLHAVQDAGAGTIRHDVPDQDYLDLAAQPQFDSVGYLDITNPDGLFLGSGTLINPYWVLTAGHNVSFPDATSLTFTLGDTSYTASEWIRHPLWNSDTGVNGYDMALVRLSEEITDVIPALRYYGSAELSATATIVGFGMTGTGLTGEVDFSEGFPKRAGNNILDVLGGSSGNSDNYLMIDFDNPDLASHSSFGSSVPLSLEYSSAHGDSGGGVFIDDGGVWKVAGVVAFGQDGPLSNPNSELYKDYGDLSGFTRVTIFNEWIDEHVQPAVNAPPVYDDGTVVFDNEGLHPALVATAIGGAGSNGNSTSINSSINGAVGGRGGDGGDATAEAISNYETNTATATGGAGGGGGAGGPTDVFSNPPGTLPAGRGGTGGEGGDATATARTTLPANVAATAKAIATAWGGAGGGGGSGGADGPTLEDPRRGPFGYGNDGGDAVASAEATSSQALPVIVEATAIGGAAGAGSDPGDPGNASLGTVRGISHAGGPVTVTGTAKGGMGAWSLGSGPGTDGGSVTLNNAVAGSTTGSLTLKQVAIGGDGGPSNPLTISGGSAGGSASSSLNYAVSQTSSLSLIAEATGGTPDFIRGDGVEGVEGATGTASAQGTNDFSNSVDITATARGGRGGTAYSTSNAIGGTGGDAVLGPLNGVSTGGGDVSVTGTAIGGDGGIVSALAGRTGDGRSISLTNEVEGFTTGHLTLKQVAIGGNAADAFGELMDVGVAGTATSSLTHTSNASQLTLESQATGGNGSLRGHSDDAGGDGADATVVASGTKISNGNLFVNGRATGGNGGSSLGGSGFAGGDGGRGGDANSLSYGSNDGSGDVTVDDSAIGGAGGDAKSEGFRAGDGGAAQSTATAITTGNGTTEAKASQTGGAGGTGLSGADGGDGAYSTLSNAVSGTSDGLLKLGQVATGGAAGGSHGGSVGLAGDALSQLTATDPGGGGLNLSPHAFGGAGGTGNDGTGGGDGGSATASGTGTAEGDVFIDVISNGGSGGRTFANETTGIAAGDGGLSTMSFAVANSTSGDATASVTQRGGDGGFGSKYFNGTVVANGGNGADSILGTAPSGSAAGTLTLNQYAVGGVGGGSDGGTVGVAGLAESILAALNPTATELIGVSSASGGAGGTGIGGSDGGAGATAIAGIDFELAGDITATATAIGGQGGNANGGGTAGDGSAASLGLVRGVSTAGGAVLVTGNLTGGAGGDAPSGGYGGNGAGVSVENAVTGSTSGLLALVQNATGGAGGGANGVFIGAAGIASSSLTTSNSGGDDISAKTTATGGRGGSPSVAQAHGGDGATATANTEVTDSGDVTAIAQATGGSGANATRAGFYGGSGAGALATAAATSTGGGNAKASVLQVGGAGGDGRSWMPHPSAYQLEEFAHAGYGASSTLIDAVSGSTAGMLTLEQTAIGGDAGGTIGGLVAAAGTASSSLTTSNEGGSISATTTATGGSGGDASASGNGFGEAHGGDGAAATANAEVTGSGDVTAVAHATGGSGASAVREGYFGGTGGEAVATAAATSTGGGTAKATAIQVGGAGGNGKSWQNPIPVPQQPPKPPKIVFEFANGGNGPSSFLVDAVSGSTSGLLTLEQFATGGNGGDAMAEEFAEAGLAGNSASYLTATNEGGADIVGLVKAQGGRGGNGTVGQDGGGASTYIDLVDSGNVTATANTIGGNGGNGSTSGSGALAESTAYATSTEGGTATANSNATGGNAGLAEFSNGTGGGAIALAWSDSPGGASLANAMAIGGKGDSLGAAHARAFASGASGMTSAESRAGDAPFGNFTAKASSEVGSWSAAETYIAWNQVMPEIPTAGERNAMVFAVMDPDPTDVANVIANAPTVTSSIIGSSMLVAMQSVLSGDAANTPHSFQTSIDVRFDDDQGDLARLVLGLANPVVIDAGFDELHFAIQSGGDMLIDEQFDSVATATAYFADSVFTMDDLGLSPTGEFELSISLDATISTPGAGFQAWLVAGEVTGTLMGDYNGDNEINGADYVVWRKTFGQTGSALAADGNHNNQIDSGDYDVWRSHFGQTLGSGAGAIMNAAVPEPATLPLMMFAAAGWCLRRGRAA